MVDTFIRHSKAKLVAQAMDSRLDLEKTNLDSGRGRTFFLTSLLIELIEGFAGARSWQHYCGDIRAIALMFASNASGETGRPRNSFSSTEVSCSIP